MVPFTSVSAVRGLCWPELKVAPPAEAVMVTGLPASSAPVSTSIACNLFVPPLSLVATKTAPCGPTEGSTTGAAVLKGAEVPREGCQSCGPVSASNPKALIAEVEWLDDVAATRMFFGTHATPLTVHA